MCPTLSALLWYDSILHQWLDDGSGSCMIEPDCTTGRGQRLLSCRSVAHLLGRGTLHVANRKHQRPRGLPARASKIPAE